MPGETVVLVSQEGEKFELDVESAKMSQVIASMIADEGTDEDIPFVNIKTPTLRKVVEYCSRHKGIPPPEIERPLRSSSLATVVSREDFEFIDIDVEDLFELLMAANFLNIKPLLELASAQVASLIKGKKVEEIRQMFNITNDFTPEQEEQVRQENRWCEDM